MRQILSLTSLIFTTFLFGQDINFNQVNLTNVYSNPALTGVNGQQKISAAYRNQWPGLSGHVGSIFLSYQNGESNYGNFGAYVMNTNFWGAFNSTRFELNYAFPIALGEDLVITPGLSGSIINDRIDFSKITFGDLGNPRTGEIYDITDPLNLQESSLSAAFSGGLLVTYKNFFIGSSFNHWGSIGLQSVFNTYTNFGATFKTLDGDVVIIPEVSHSSISGFQRLEFKVSGQYKWAKLGVEYAMRDGLSYVVGAQIGKFNVLYSSELIFSPLTNTTFNAHELGLSYNFKTRNENKVNHAYQYSLF